MPPQAELKGHVDKRTFLSAHPFFKGLKPELIDQIGSHAIIRVVKAGAVIYGKGDPGDSLVKVALPVTFTPGRLRLATRPDATGSPPPVNTIGMVVVAPCQVGNINRLLPLNMLLNEVIDLSVQAALGCTLVR